MVVRRIAIIPARGGSQRIPKKNVIDFCGRPMIAWTIEAAIKSNMFDRVLVSTDDEDIASIALNYGAEVPFLRRHANDHHSPVSLATIHALRQAENYWNQKYEIVVQLMANCPNRTADDIKNALYRFEELNRDFQISCARYGWLNPWWAVKLGENGRPIPLHKVIDIRSQDLPVLYCPTGAIWIAKSDLLKKHKTFYGPNHCFEPIDLERAVDIDDFEDYKVAKALRRLVTNS